MSVFVLTKNLIFLIEEITNKQTETQSTVTQAAVLKQQNKT